MGLNFMNRDYVDKYYEDKKKNGLILTKGRISGNNVNVCTTVQPYGVSWWSRSLKRYRTSKEQSKYVSMLISSNKLVVLPTKQDEE